MDDEEIIVENSDEDEIIDEEEPSRNMERDTNWNPDDQPLHPDEDKLRGKFAIDLPVFTPVERQLIGATTRLRDYFTKPDTAEETIPKELLPHVRRMAKTCKIIQGRVVKIKSRGGIKEVPESLAERRHILEEAHEGGGHKGLDGTMGNVTSRYWMPALEKIVLRHIFRCQQCQKYAKANKFESPNYAATVWDILKHWNIDFMGPFPPDPDGNKYAIIAVESLTRWAEGMPTKTNTAAEAANFLYNHIVSRYGIPEAIGSDNGPHFANEVIENLTQILSVRHHFSTPYYPQSNGRAERFISTIKPMLVKSIQTLDRKDNGTINWTPVFFSTLYIYRSTKHSATGVSPAFLLYGEELKLPLQFDPSSVTNQIQQRDQIAAHLSALRGFILGLRTSRFRYAQDTEGPKILVRPAAYKINEKVLLRASKFDNPGHSASPFEFRYNGPYQIHKVLDKGAYVLKTLPDDNDKVKYFRKPVNWIRLRR